MDTGVLSAIGKTPLVKLTRVFVDARFHLFAKLEGCNPGGSIKDRAALSIIRHAFEMGAIGPGSVVVESSSGNMGIGLAQVCAHYGLRFICVVDPKTTAQNIDILRAYGAEVDLVWSPDPITGEYLQARINRVETLIKKMEKGFWPNQYANLHNALAHQQTMHEIVTDLNDQVDYLFCTTSTCGTLRGCVTYVRDRKLKTKIYAIDAIGSVIAGGERATRLIPGHGAAIVPPLYHENLADRFIHVSDLDCVVGCRRLMQTEAILAGGSSGATVMGIDRIKDEIPAGAVCVAIFADRGERYLDTIYSDKWISVHFGDVAHLWQNKSARQTCFSTA